jgi:hypothetical protein
VYICAAKAKKNLWFCFLAFLGRGRGYGEANTQLAAHRRACGQAKRALQAHLWPSEAGLAGIQAHLHKIKHTYKIQADINKIMFIAICRLVPALRKDQRSRTTHTTRCALQVPARFPNHPQPTKALAGWAPL